MDDPDAPSIRSAIQHYQLRAGGVDRATPERPLTGAGGRHPRHVAAHDDLRDAALRGDSRGKRDVSRQMALPVLIAGFETATLEDDGIRRQEVQGRRAVSLRERS